MTIPPSERSSSVPLWYRWREQCDDDSLAGFDIVLCSLALHHFSRTAAVRILQDMNRLCRVGFIVNDLSRSYLALACAWLYTRTTTTNVMTRTDALASVLAAFTRNELAGITDDSGVGPLEISRAPFFRLIAVKRKDG